ncbi:putative leader peptide [Streptomyces sp. NPDC050264]|uniref:putative leader peptide n=1 Tax=Streptomyces sp. NPDC050264 TaxID=3155038 RepID=UPI003425616A
MDLPGRAGLPGGFFKLFSSPHRVFLEPFSRLARARLARFSGRSGRELTAIHSRGVLRSVTIDTDVRLWRRVHMDLVRYAGCVCRPSC